MAGIEQYLADILSAKYGEEVRSSIHDAIQTCYEDGKAGATDLVARQQIANLVANVPEGSEKDSELVDIRVGYDGTQYTSAGEAVRKQIGGINDRLMTYVDMSLSFVDDMAISSNTNNRAFATTSSDVWSYVLFEPNSDKLIVDVELDTYHPTIYQFDSDNNLIGSPIVLWEESNTPPYELTVGSDVKKVGINIAKSDKGTLVVKKHTYLDINEEIDAVRGQISSLSEDSYYHANLIDEVVNTVYEKNWIDLEPIQSFDKCVLSGLSKSDNRYTKCMIDSGSGGDGHLVFVYKVHEGFTYNIMASVFPASYTGLGVCFIHSKEYLQKNVQYNILTGYDYYMGKSDAVWQISNLEIKAPKTANYVIIHAFNQDAHCKVKDTNEDNARFALKSKNPITDFFETKKIYEIENNPVANVGTVSKQSMYSRFNRPAWLWEFSNVGKLTLSDISINTNAGDSVGIWIYVNEAMCDYENNTDGTFNVLIDGAKDGDTILPAYQFASGWNYVPISILDANNHTVEFDFNMVRGNYKFAIDTFEINYIPKIKPQILLSFDMSGHAGGNVCNDNRYDLIHQYGFVATFCNPDDSSISQEDRDKVFSEGWDWAIYNKSDSSDLDLPSWATGTVDEWKAYIKTHIDSCEDIGLFEPISYFSPQNRATPNLEQALRKLGFKIARIAGSNKNAVNLVWFNDYNNLYINCFGVGGTDTAETILQHVDNALNNNSSVCIFTHNVEDALTNNMNTTVSVYTAILEGIKERVEKGLCEVSTFTDFFRKWCPESCAAKLELRHEKEKQYIMSKITNNN